MLELKWQQHVQHEISMSKKTSYTKYRLCLWCKTVEDINPRTDQPYSHCLEHRKAKRKIAKKWESKNTDKVRSRTKVYNRKLRRRFFDMYGHKCACLKCPETNTKFMTIDHIQGGGIKHRKITGSNNKMIREAIAEYRSDLYQPLCYNCNCGRSANGGTCPHLEE